MQTITVQVAIPDALEKKFTERVKTHGGDPLRYVQEAVAKDLVSMEDPERQRRLDAVFEDIHTKYGEALGNLAK